MAIPAYVDQLAETAPERFRTPAFKALQRQWYARLEADGFVDSELESQGQGWRIRRAASRGNPAAEYYRVAAWWLHERVWPRRRDRRAWELHAEGMTMGEISAALSPMDGCSGTSVKLLIQREAALMRKYYRTKDGNSDGTSEDT